MLVTLEGIDGSGKSTQARLLVERLGQAGYAVLPVREPGGTELSEQVRRLLLDPSLHVEPFAELLLFSAARAQLVAERIRPALAGGTVVVCDRFYDSTTAYQGGGRGLEDTAWIDAFNRRVTGGLVPDRTYLVVLDPEEALARRAARDAGGADRMEAAERGFHERVAAAYERLAEADPERILRLDGRQPPEEIHARIWSDLAPRLQAMHGTAIAGSG